MRCCCAATRRWCAPRGCAGATGTRTTGTGHGPAWRVSRTGMTCCRGRSTPPRSVSFACSAMPISALPIAAGARPIRSSTPSIRKCWNGPRSRSRYHRPRNHPSGDGSMFEGCRISQRLGFAAVFVFATPGFALAQSNEKSPDQRNLACGSPVALEDGWIPASPESVGLDGARLCGISARLKEMEADVHSVVIVRHGKLVFEQYFPGYDEPWGQVGAPHEFDASTRHDMRSA